MTGYVSKSFEFDDFSIFIEIKSLNSKFLEIKFNLPVYIEHMENRLRQILKNYVKRGKVDVFVMVTAKEQMEYRLLRALIDKYHTIVRRIEADTGYSFQVSLSDLLSLRAIFSTPDESFSITIPEEKFEKNFKETVESFQRFRLREGDITKSEIMGYIEMIENSLNRIELSYPSVIVKYQQQLRNKIRELIDAKVDETRLIMEACIFANKVDVSEEISRMRGHLSNMKSILETDGSCGRELDFITQEVHREINTLGAKVPDYAVSEQVVLIKTNLEKIKEQVRNIE